MSDNKKRNIILAVYAVINVGFISAAFIDGIWMGCIAVVTMTADFIAEKYLNVIKLDEQSCSTKE